MGEDARVEGNMVPSRWNYRDCLVSHQGTA